MAEDKGISGTGLIIGMLVSAAIGALVAYLVLSNKQKTLSSLDASVPASTIQQPTTHPAPSYTSTSFASMSPGIMSGSAFQHPTTHPIPDTPVSPSIMSGSMNGSVVYNNKEKWKIARNDNGDIDSIEVIRDANIDGR